MQMKRGSGNVSALFLAIALAAGIGAVLCRWLPDPSTAGEPVIDLRAEDGTEPAPLISVD